MPFIPPMLCSRLERLTERRHIAEPKLDGQRAQVEKLDDLLRRLAGAAIRGDGTWARATAHRRGDPARVALRAA